MKKSLFFFYSLLKKLFTCMLVLNSFEDQTWLWFIFLEELPAVFFDFWISRGILLFRPLACFAAKQRKKATLWHTLVFCFISRYGEKYLLVTVTGWKDFRLYFYMYFSNLFERAGCDTRWIFKWSLTVFNSFFLVRDRLLF